MRGTILLVDRTSQGELTLTAALGRRPFAVTKALSCEDARKQLEMMPIDIMFCDDELQDGTWLELLAFAAERFPATIRIAMVRHVCVVSAVRAINDARAFALLKKPIERVEMKVALDGAIQMCVSNFAERAMLDMRGLQGDPGPAEEIARLSVHASGEHVVPPFAGLPGGLSLREWEVLGQVVAGKTIDQIAKKLFISVFTARNHLKAMYRKLGLHSRAALVDWYKEMAQNERATDAAQAL